MPVNAFFTGINNASDFLALGVAAGLASVAVDFGDGSGTSLLPPGSVSHSYAADGIYTIKVTETATGDFERLRAFLYAADTLGQVATGSGLDDLMLGGSGNDSLIGQGGDDWVFGGLGNDTISGGAGRDFLNGNGGADIIDGGNDNDLILGEQGDDSLSGGNGADALNGADGNDTLDGGDGDDVLIGREGLDRITGGTGADEFIGGEGKDLLITTNDGATDVFEYQSIRDRGDNISGFVPGQDKIALFFIDDAASPQFASGPTPAPGSAGVWVLYDTDDGRLSVDLDGSGAGLAVPMATLKGAPALSMADLLFG